MILSRLAQFLRLTTSSSSSAPTPHPIFRHPLGLVPLTPGSPTETLWPRTSLKKCGHSGPDVTRLGLQYVVSSLCLATFKSRSFLLPSNSRACVLRYKVVLLVIPCRRHPPSPLTPSWRTPRAGCCLGSDTILLNFRLLQCLRVGTVICSLRWSTCLLLDFTATPIGRP